MSLLKKATGLNENRFRVLFHSRTMNSCEFRPHGTQFLLRVKKWNLPCFIQQNNTTYCLPKEIVCPGIKAFGTIETAFFLSLLLR